MGIQKVGGIVAPAAVIADEAIVFDAVSGVPGNGGSVSLPFLPTKPLSFVCQRDESVQYPKRQS